jgi:ELWxxDGT repeat protein
MSVTIKHPILHAQQTGTFLVQDINPGPEDSGPSLYSHSDALAINGTAYFTADDGTTGEELWKSDGTAAGTTLVKDIRPGLEGSNPLWFANLNGVLYFTADDGTNGHELWKSDGTETGTVLVKDIAPGSDSSSPNGTTVFNNEIFFSAATSDSGLELWKSDGTAGGTVLVREHVGYTGISPKELTVVGNTLFFGGSTDTNDTALWVSDGTTVGTTILQYSINVTDIVAGGNTAYIFVDNFFGEDDELWKSDGTPVGTTQLGTFPSLGASQIEGIAVIDSTLYFVADDGTTGDALWKSDGTVAGTTLVADIRTPADNNIDDPIRNLTSWNGALYFSGNDGTNGTELWTSDGTAAGTTLVKDICPGIAEFTENTPCSANPGFFTSFNTSLYFAADDGVHGYELWKTDGTEAGTVLVADIRYGPSSSSPDLGLVTDNTLLFSAKRNVTGSELWATDGEVVTLEPFPITCDNNQPPFYAGQSYDLARETNIPPYLDVVGFNSTLDDNQVTAVIELRDIPNELPYNRTDVPDFDNEYEWSITIDLDGNPVTEEDKGGFGWFYDNDNNEPPATAPLEDFVKTVTIRYGNIRVVDQITSSDINDTTNVMTVTAIVDGVSPVSRMYVTTSESDGTDWIRETTGCTTEDSQTPGGSSAISGTVMNDRGEPLPDIAVTAYREVNNTWFASETGITDAAGNYTIPELVAGNYRIYFSDPGNRYGATYYNNTSRFTEAQILSLQEEASISPIDASLSELPPPIATVTGSGSTGTLSDGRVSIGVPRGSQETVDVTVSLSCPDDTSPSNVTLTVGNATFAMTSTGDGQYSATLTTPDDLPNASGPFNMTVTYDCATPQSMDIGEWRLYDPSGIITDASTGQPVEGAVVSLYRVPDAMPDTATETNDCRTVNTRPSADSGQFGSWSGVPATILTAGVWLNPDIGVANGTPEIDPAVNPQTTGSDGRYAWDVVEGCWYVVVEAAGYPTVVSPLVGVPPEVTDLDITLPADNQQRHVFLPLINR